MLNAEQAALVKGMLARGDKQHDIAAVFGVNSGRIASIATGEKHPDIPPAPTHKLPPPVKSPRFIDPNAPLEQQWQMLKLLIKDPPENSRIITITPKLATKILDELNTFNRKKRPSRIKRYKEALLNDNWILSGDTLKFGLSGKLLDGQNRLLAAQMANKRLRTHVVFGIDDMAFTVIDTNAVRSNTDAARLEGLPYPAIAAAAVRWLMIYALWKPSEGQLNQPNRGLSFSNQELIDYYRENIDADRFAQAMEHASRSAAGVPKGNLAAHYYMFSNRNEPVATRFINDMISGKRVGRKLPARIASLRKQTLGRVHEGQINAFICQAWNAYHSGKSVTQTRLNWNDTKEYPIIA